MKIGKGILRKKGTEQTPLVHGGFQTLSQATFISTAGRAKLELKENHWPLVEKHQNMTSSQWSPCQLTKIEINKKSSSRTETRWQRVGEP